MEALSKQNGLAGIRDTVMIYGEGVRINRTMKSVAHWLPAGDTRT